MLHLIATYLFSSSHTNTSPIQIGSIQFYMYVHYPLTTLSIIRTFINVSNHSNILMHTSRQDTYFTISHTVAAKNHLTNTIAVIRLNLNQNTK